MDQPSALLAEIRRRIARDGPLTVADYMALCLGHPEFGYYLTHDPFGSAGDFVTAPEISQMFGELIGLWAASAWFDMGAPANVRLIEMGPGRGTMMKDILRAGRMVTGFVQAVSVDLVETSPVLCKSQKATLGGESVAISWHERLADIPAGPSIIIANEFVDALPVHQAVKQEDGWHERTVNLDASGNLAFGFDARLLDMPQTLSTMAPAGSICEWRDNSEVAEIASRIVRDGGAALLIDYGHLASGAGDTFQAVRNHAFADPLEDPGNADLTAHVDFEQVAKSARDAGASVFQPLEQGEFLRRIGIDARADVLKAKATPSQAAEIDAALLRLTGSGKGEMGSLFKVIAFSSAAIESLPGFDLIS